MRAFIAAAVFCIATVQPLHADDRPARAQRAATAALDQAWAMPSPPGARNGAVFAVGIVNRSDRSDRLLGASTPVARSVELHQTIMQGDVARMREQEAFDLPAQSSVDMTRGGSGRHVMLMDLKAPLREGQTIPLTLRFERAGTLNVLVPVKAAAPTGAAEGQTGGHEHAHPAGRDKAPGKGH